MINKFEIGDFVITRMGEKGIITSMYSTAFDYTIELDMRPRYTDIIRFHSLNSLRKDIKRTRENKLKIILD